MKRLTVRQFRSQFAQLDEPVEVGEGLWIPNRLDTKAIVELLREFGVESIPVRSTSTSPPRAHITDVTRDAEMKRMQAQQASRDAILRKMVTKSRRS